MNDDGYFESQNEFNKQEKLYHFTNFEALKMILKNKTLRLSLIDEFLNDEMERYYIDDLYRNCCFVVSLTSNDYNSNVMWERYSKDSKSGICIMINKKKIKNFTNFIVVNEKKEIFSKTRLEEYSNCKKYDKDYYWYVKDSVGLKVIYKDEPFKDVTYCKDMIDFFSDCNSTIRNKVKEDFTNVKTQDMLKIK